MAARNVVAVDLGAESGRVVLGRFDGARVTLTEVHRFPTPPYAEKVNRLVAEDREDLIPEAVAAYADEALDTITAAKAA